LPVGGGASLLEQLDGELSFPKVSIQKSGRRINRTVGEMRFNSGGVRVRSNLGMMVVVSKGKLKMVLMGWGG